MGLDNKDIKMMSISVPVVDYWEMKEDIDKLTDVVERIENIVECLIELYRSERVKGWELLLKGLLEREERKGRMIKPFKIEDFKSAYSIVED